MGIAETSLRLLFPRGSAWTLAGHGGALIRGIAKAVQRILDDAAQIVPESRPGTATEDTLREWHATLAQRYDPTRPLAVQRARLEAFRVSAGGSTLDKLRAQVQLEYPDLDISDTAIGISSEAGEDECGIAACNAPSGTTDALHYLVFGTVESESDALRVGQIIGRFGALHLIAEFSITVLSLTANTEAGLAVCGLEECGNDGT